MGSLPLILVAGSYVAKQIVRFRAFYYIEDGCKNKLFFLQTSMKYQIIKSVGLAVEILRLGRVGLRSLRFLVDHNYFCYRIEHSA
jgi:hypothetical protein